MFKNQLNKDMAGTLSEATNDEGRLFGKDFLRVQSAKALDRTSSQLKKSKEGVAKKFKAPS